MNAPAALALGEWFRAESVAFPYGRGFAGNVQGSADFRGVQEAIRPLVKIPTGIAGEREMRRRIDGHWEYRKPTADEEESHAQTRAW